MKKSEDRYKARPHHVILPKLTAYNLISVRKKISLDVQQK